MALWRIHLRPDSDGIDPVDVCLKQQIIGVGWRVEVKPTDRDHYWALGEKRYGDKGWSTAANAIGWRISVGDLVWVRDFYGSYYVGRVSGEWEYRDAPENLKADIINVRPCKLYRVGTSVAGKIVSCFVPSSTVQQIHDDTAEMFSTFVYNKLAQAKLPLYLKTYVDVFSLLSSVDIEDVIGLYLQQSVGLLFVPSSRSRRNATMSYEYQLVDPKSGKPAYVQVKSGNIVLDPSQYYEFPDQVYLFSPAGYCGPSNRSHVKCIDRESIVSFLSTARIVLPLNITVWLEMAEELSQYGKTAGYHHAGLDAFSLASLAARAQVSLALGCRKSAEQRFFIQK